MKFLVTLFLAGTCLSAMAGKVTEEELNQFAEQLKTAETIEDNSQPSDDQIIDLNPRERAWNPLTATAAYLKNSCSCTQGECACCANIPVLNSKGCLSANIADGGVNVAITLGGTPVVARTLPLSGKKEFCGNLPKKALGIGFCLTGESRPVPQGTEVCSSLTLNINGQNGATMNFQCVTVSRQSLSVGAQKLSGLKNFNYKAPFKQFVSVWHGKRSLD